jgi:dihydropyrimidinase
VGETVLDLAIRGGTVVTASGSRSIDVGIRTGRIVSLGEVGEARDSLDAAGRLVLPGAIDVHTHMRLPSKEHPDRFFDDTVAAVMGGTTTVLSFIEQPRGGSLLDTLIHWRKTVENEAASDYGFHPIITELDARAETEIPAVIDSGCPTFKAFMVYQELRITDDGLFRAMELTADHGGMMMVHCENEVLLQALIARHLSEGLTAPRYHAPSRPPMIEGEATHRALCMARIAGAPVYIVHLSCADALEMLMKAKDLGQQAFAETCPHYLTLTARRYEASDEEATKFVISPPLRDEHHREILWSALRDGILDVVGSDHVPRRLEDEQRASIRDFTQIPNGAPGIETLPSLVYDGGVSSERITLERMVEILSTAPARLFGLENKGSIEVGKDADLVIWDPDSRRVLSQSDLHHSADFTPYEGLAVTGAVETTLVRGRIVADKGTFIGERGGGEFIPRTLSNPRARS